MATTVEDVKKSVSDANTAAAIANLQAQVERTKAAYNAMNTNARNTAAQGQGFIQNQMQKAGVQQPVSTSAGIALNSAAGEAFNSNRQAQQLAGKTMQSNIRYLQGAANEQADKLARQAAQQKAENLAQYGDFSGYGELGYSPEQIRGMKTAYDAENNKPEDYAGLGKYAETLLDLYAGNAGFDIESNLQEAMQNGLITARDYQAALIAARGIVPGSKAKKKSGGSDAAEDAGSTVPDDAIYAAAQDAMRRVTGIRDGKYVVTDGADWAALQNYYGDRIGEHFVYDEERVVTPMGEITYTEAEKLEQEGKLVMVGVDINGDPIFSLPYSKNPYTADQRR